MIQYAPYAETAIKYYTWEGIPEEQMKPLVSRQVIHGETMTVARLRLRKGAVVPLHHHVNEQITLLEKGRLRFVIARQEHVVSAGEAMQIPPNAPQTAEAL